MKEMYTDLRSVWDDDTGLPTAGSGNERFRQECFSDDDAFYSSRYYGAASRGAGESVGYKLLNCALAGIVVLAYCLFLHLF